MPPKNSKRPVISKRILKAKFFFFFFFYAIFFSGECVTIQVQLEKDKSVTEKYYKNVVLKKLKKKKKKKNDNNNTIRNCAQSRVSNITKTCLYNFDPLNPTFI